MQYSTTRFFIFLIVTFFLGTVSHGQSFYKKPDPIKVTFYYNTSWELTTPENSSYHREAYYDLTDMVFDGIFSDYNKQGELISDGFYNHGVKSGIHSEYVNHAVKTKVEYSGDVFTIWEWNDGRSDGVKNGTGKFHSTIFYFVISDGQIVSKHGTMNGEFRNGRRIGKWIYFDATKEMTDVEFYSNGKFMKRMNYAKDDSAEVKEPKAIYLSLISLNAESLAYDANSFGHLNQYFEKYVPYPPSFNRNVTYPNGIRFLLRRMSAEMIAPERNIEVVELKIDASGQLVKHDVVRSISRVYDNLIEGILNVHKKRFLPAIRNGRPETTIIYLPVASGDEWITTVNQAPIDYLLDYSNFNR